jgi:hypothetical protein
MVEWNFFLVSLRRYYPNLSSNLQCEGVPAWVVGDACGLFRGIVASMLSGYYVGSLLSHNFGEKDNETIVKT